MTNKNKDWEKEIRELFNQQRQISSGLARIGGDYPEPEEQALSLIHSLLSQTKQELNERHAMELATKESNWKQRETVWKYTWQEIRERLSRDIENLIDQASNPLIGLGGETTGTWGISREKVIKLKSDILSLLEKVEEKE